MTRRTRFDAQPLFATEQPPESIAAAFERAAASKAPTDAALAALFTQAAQAADRMRALVRHATRVRELGDAEVPRERDGGPKHGVMSARSMCLHPDLVGYPSPVLAIALASLAADDEIAIRTVTLHDWVLWMPDDAQTWAPDRWKGAVREDDHAA